MKFFFIITNKETKVLHIKSQPWIGYTPAKRSDTSETNTISGTNRTSASQKKIIAYPNNRPTINSV